jgi:hypothetical protein
LPANGESLTRMTIVIVGSSMAITGIGSTVLDVGERVADLDVLDAVDAAEVAGVDASSTSRRARPSKR